MLKEMLEQVRRREPLIHSIMNRVAINDCANLLLACGASPIMAEDEAEVEEITTLSDGLTINMGMLSQRLIPSMKKAGRQSAYLGHITVLDPVGAGASAFRRQTAGELLQDISFRRSELCITVRKVQEGWTLDVKRPQKRKDSRRSEWQEHFPDRRRRW